VARPPCCPVSPGCPPAGSAAAVEAVVVGAAVVVVAADRPAAVAEVKAVSCGSSYLLQDPSPLDVCWLQL
jgi:hypothetical protein